MNNRVPTNCFDMHAFRVQNKSCTRPLPLFKQAIEKANQYFDQRFLRNAPIDDLITLRADFVDQLLRCVWERFDWGNDESVALIAVGGYGRGELHPHSDIDLLILLEDGKFEHHKSAIESFITFLWDINLEIGHSVRTVSECQLEARSDITVATNLMESRLLCGPSVLFLAMTSLVGPDRIWPSREFFRAKWDEQIGRHKKYNDTEYNLEPNVKGCPGGLRDLQMIGWVAKRHFGASSLHELVTQGFLSEDEYKLLTDSQRFLWRTRYALHMLSKRAEDRLLFEYQVAIAKILGFTDNDNNLAVERFMKHYYRWAIAASELNDMLMQLFDEAILKACEPVIVRNINPRFRLRNNYIEVTNSKVFLKTPSAMMELFVIMANDDNIFGVRAETIRLIREARHLIDNNFREDARNRSLFVELLRAPRRVASMLKRMKRYGVLGNYLTEFGAVIGQTQHDLFHIYTVDAHTILVIKNLRRFGWPEATEQYPLCAAIVKRIPKRELLYLAGLFHDIAKGRGGDHSTLGADDAFRFCINHGFSVWDANLVSWLVRNHLLMSYVSQRKDTSDPEVIHDFARKVGDQMRLDYLYTLTVADISATNPALWTSWRASLMRNLYVETRRALRRGLENPADKQQWIAETMANSMSRLEKRGFARDQIFELWDNPGDDFFLRETVNDIVWESEAIANHADKSKPMILIKESGDGQFSGATQIFVYAKNRPSFFALVAGVMAQLDLNIVDARIYSSRSNYTLDTFFVLNADGAPLGNDPYRVRQIHDALYEQLSSSEDFTNIVQRRTPRRLKYFSFPTLTSMTTDPNRNCTILEVITADRPGLLARIGSILVDYNIDLQTAKIATLGERVEDIFYITDRDGNPITDPELSEKIQTSIKQTLDQHSAQLGNGAVA